MEIITPHIEMLLKEISDFDILICNLKTNILNREFPSEEDVLIFEKNFKKDLTQKSLFDIWQNADARRIDYYEEKKLIVQEKINSIRNKIQEKLDWEETLRKRREEFKLRNPSSILLKKPIQENKTWTSWDSFNFAREETRRARRDWYEDGGGGNEWSSSPDE